MKHLRDHIYANTMPTERTRDSAEKRGMIRGCETTKGTRVITPLGPGTVAYVRMGPPDYSNPEVVSVVVDSRLANFGKGYVGTTFAAVEVSPMVASAPDSNIAGGVNVGRRPI